MRDINIVKSMKDFYWDIRPKPEFGTVEVRVCDMPLKLDKAIMLAAYIQTIASYLIKQQPFELRADLYDAYHYSRFQASHFGYDGKFINPFTLETTTIQKDILITLKILRPYAKAIGTYSYLYHHSSWQNPGDPR
jgi:carboxylate-amine ligase